MVFEYRRSDPHGRLSQGEILSELQEPQPEHPRGRISPSSPEVPFELVEHSRVVILTPDCDLLTDFPSRNGSHPNDETKLLQHVQCCDVYEESGIRQSGRFASDLCQVDPLIRTAVRLK